MLQPFEEELAEWDDWLVRAARSRFSMIRLRMLRKRMRSVARLRRAENAPDQADQLLIRVAKINDLLDEQGS